MIIRSKAPLRLGLAGGGTDVSPFCDTYGGAVLNATIDMHTYCTLEPLDVPKVIFIAADKDVRFESNAVKQLSVTGELPLHKGVYNRIVKDFNGGQPLNIKLITYSDAPPGSGLGTSSTLVVAILKAFVEYLNLPLGEYDIAWLAFEIERIDLRMDGGRQDQYAATFGGFNFIEFFPDNRVVVNPLRIKNWIKDELEGSLVLCFTGLSRDSDYIIRQQTDNVHKGDAAPMEAMKALKRYAYEMKAALLKGDIKGLAEILDVTWQKKMKTADCITNTHINTLYETAKANGAYAGKISGAGGGGFMTLIVDPVKRIQVEKALEDTGGLIYHVKFDPNGTRGWKLY